MSAIVETVLRATPNGVTGQALMEWVSVVQPAWVGDVVIHDFAVVVTCVTPPSDPPPFGWAVRIPHSGLPPSVTSYIASNGNVPGNFTFLPANVLTHYAVDVQVSLISDGSLYSQGNWSNIASCVPRTGPPSPPTTGGESWGILAA